MSRLNLRVITGPTIEPVTLDDAKLHAHISHDIEDTVILNWIKAAREEAEGYQRRAFISQVLELSFDEYPCMPVSLPRAPVITVDSIKIYDYQNTETVLYLRVAGEGGTLPATNSNFIIDTDSEPGRIALALGKVWPGTVLREINSVKIRYTAGYGTAAASVPAAVKDAIMLYCSYRNDNRTAEVDFPRQFYDLLSSDRVHL